MQAGGGRVFGRRFGSVEIRRMAHHEWDWCPGKGQERACNPSLLLRCHLQPGRGFSPTLHRQQLNLEGLASRAMSSEFPWLTSRSVYGSLVRAIWTKTVPLAQLHGTCVPRVLFLAHGHLMNESLLVVHGGPHTSQKDVSPRLTQYCRSLPRASVTVWWRSRVNLIFVSLSC